MVVFAALIITGVGIGVAPTIAASYGAMGLTGVFFVLGVVNGPLFPCCSVMLRDCPPADRSQAMAIVDAGGTLGGCLATALCPAIATLIGWQRLFLLLAAVAFGTAAIFQWKAVDPSVSMETKEAASNRG